MVDRGAKSNHRPIFLPDGSIRRQKPRQKPDIKQLLWSLLMSFAAACCCPQDVRKSRFTRILRGASCCGNIINCKRDFATSAFRWYAWHNTVDRFQSIFLAKQTSSSWMPDHQSRTLLRHCCWCGRGLSDQGPKWPWTEVDVTVTSTYLLTYLCKTVWKVK